MNCRHCGEPIERCDRVVSCAFYDCRGWRHARDSMHTCTSLVDRWESAEPEPGTPGGEIAPTPGKEVA